VLERTTRGALANSSSARIGARPLRIALLSYRSKANCGGQGVYVRHLSRELAALGHDVEVISGPPYPILDPGPRLTKVTSLDLYRTPNQVRRPKLTDFRDRYDWLEYGVSLTGAFPEPLAFSMRVWQLLRSRPVEQRPDIVHDNQTLGYGMLLMQREGFPVVATVHHPITIDYRLERAGAVGLQQKFGVMRWYSFLRMQGRVVRRIPSLLTVSDSSRDDSVTEFKVPHQRITTVPNGVQHEIFAPPKAPRVPGRIVTTASADTPLKGLRFLLEAVAMLREEQSIELVVVGTLNPDSVAAATVKRLGLSDVVTFVSDIEEEQLVELFGSATVGVVPSLYEGFSLPAVEMMACATPLVVTRTGALPEVVGPDGEAAILVPPGDAAELKFAIKRLLADPGLAEGMGSAGRNRVVEKFTWGRVALQTTQWYQRRLEKGKAMGATLVHH
jgi:glycosyltransferase involved in cell wall biosynthesis